ncbi:MAG: Xaa-Pro peptidase family protein, partial [Desulforhabdus sp.]|nr:Xaa-Pro peptidase family protein [Desulforhabdus sp.]
MANDLYRERIRRCCHLMEKAGLDVMVLTKPANMFYLTGDGRLCAYAMITRQGEVALGVPSTDLEDVGRLAHFDHLTGFEDEVGMIHSIAHYFDQFGIRRGVMGLEYAYLPQPRMGMLTHPHAKPEAVVARDCTLIMSELRLVKDDGEIEAMRKAAGVAVKGMEAALQAVKGGITESQVAAAAEYAMRHNGAVDFYRSYVSSGQRTNVAHGLPTLRKLEAGDLVMIDIHPVVDGYSADMCRMACVGEPASEQQIAHDLYVKALEATIAKAKAGVEMTELEATMHGILEAAGHKDHIFGPPIHGIGIEFEESPLPPGHAFFHGVEDPAPI